MYRRLVTLGVLLVTSNLTGCTSDSSTPIAEKKQRSEPTATIAKAEPVPSYSIIEVKDVSFGETKRYSLKARVEHILSRSELEAVSKDVVCKYRECCPHNALMLFYYLPESGGSGHYTAGKATWAPFGAWGRASEVSTGDYSQHNLVVEPGNATGIDAARVTVEDMSLSDKQKVFYDLVVAQDQGVGDNEAYGIIAKKYNIKEATVRKIAVEGAVQDWPMP